MSYSPWTILLVVLLGVVTAGAIFVVLAFLAIFFASPFTAIYEDVEEHAAARHARPAPKAPQVGQPLMHH